ncbi:hypothetical protein ADZZY_72 [Mycobacterium phage Adzzy]|uniref:hypothetical protein n=1 Tax=Mycobacterium phage Adzzy TaxID=1383059 RepID=UPI0003881B26|nr:hypothetical protein ADZZY_72 [Mycobacterium phage Adzzy]AGT14320.1 hypothetical protein ADZZY_72 [Mycobacterium phage Adzzy]
MKQLKTEKVRAKELTHNQIGERVQFYWKFPLSDVRAVIMGDLREVHHDGEGVTVWLAGRNSEGDKQEFQMSPMSLVSVVREVNPFVHA